MSAARTTASAQREPLIVQRIRAAAEAGEAAVPVHAHFGVRAVGAEVGRVEVAQRMGPHCLDRHGRLSPGAFLVGGDGVLGSAIASCLGDDRSVATLSVHLQFLQMDPGAAVDFRICAEARHITDSFGTATGEIVDDTGRRIALMSSQCAVVPHKLPPMVGPSYPLDAALLAPDDPHSSEELAPMATGRVNARTFAAEPGAVGVEATAARELRNSRGDMQGGVLGLLAEQAISACLIRATPALAEADAMDLDISYLRAVRADHPRVRIVARVDHASRRFAVAHGVGQDSSGRAVVAVSGSRYRG